MSSATISGIDPDMEFLVPPHRNLGKISGRQTGLLTTSRSNPSAERAQRFWRKANGLTPPLQWGRPRTQARPGHGQVEAHAVLALDPQAIPPVGREHRHGLTEARMGSQRHRHFVADVAEPMTGSLSILSTASCPVVPIGSGC